MQDDCIAVALELPSLKIVWQRETENHIEVGVVYRRNKAICPRCGEATSKVHDRRQQVKQDRRLRDKAVFLILVKRRFQCPFCGKAFTEPDEVFGLRRRSSYRFREYLGREALDQTVRRTVQKEQVGEGLVRRCVAEEIGKRLGARESPETPEFIGLDEFSVKRRRLYHTAVCDLVKGEMMEVVEGQGQKKVEEYLDSLSQPEKARGVVDKFHLIRHVNGALDKVRSRLQGGSRRGKRRDLFRSRYILLKGAERLAHWEKIRLNQLFYRYPALKRAWLLKESFRDWYRETDRSRAEERLGLLEEEILNYFDYRITSGFVGGKNNRIKTIKRMAYGYRNMANFRLRILATNPGSEVTVSHLLT